MTAPALFERAQHLQPEARAIIVRERAAALDRVMGRSPVPATVADWLFLAQHGASDDGPEAA